MREADEIFEELRPSLSRLAYRMLGSLADADDVLQEAYLRWNREPRAEVIVPHAWLNTAVTRLCIDRRRAIDARKETYVGPWLPEPVVELEAPAADAAESVSMAMMVVLESLTPVERAAYLLRRVFDYSYAEIATMLEKSEANCRQLVSRAEEHVRQRRPRFDATRAEAERVTEAFVAACASGDLDGLVELLASDAVVYSDGGGKAKAALAPIFGADRISRFFLGIIRKTPDLAKLKAITVNGMPGLMATLEGQVVLVLTFEIVEGRIVKGFIMRNPDKLARVGIAE
ncbi:RNA polymerase sigma factor SigJ [Lacipirellula sp.]|uniref:RNA polymerase sigma factor SigJ n=1 Tax=Lacipirellula sp. TaxID=2691419 RepID=UPI003D0BE3F8